MAASASLLPSPATASASASTAYVGAPSSADAPSTSRWSARRLAAVFTAGVGVVLTIAMAMRAPPGASNGIAAAAGAGDWERDLDGRDDIWGPPPEAAQQLARSIIQENWCSALQIAVIKHCDSHCGSCDVADTDLILGDCVVVHPFGNTVVAGTTMVFEDCRGETMNAALHRESNQCSAVQQAVASHCTYHCGTCDVTITDDILGDCEVAAPDGVAVRAADQIVDDCTGERLDAALHAEALRCSELQIAVATHCAYYCSSCDLGDTEKVLGECLIDAAVVFADPAFPLPGGTMVNARDRVQEECGGSLAPAMDITRRDAVATWAGPTGAYSHHFAASSFGKEVTMTLDFISADSFTMRIEAPIPSMSKFCSSESYSYTAGLLTVAGYQSAGDCIHDALNVIHAKVKSFSYDKDADTIALSYKLLFRTHTIILSNAH